MGDWIPNSAQSFFVAKNGESWPAFQKASQAQRVHLAAGTAERWDISLLCLVLQHSDWSCVPRRRRTDQDRAIDALRRERNDLARLRNCPRMKRAICCNAS